MLVGKFWFVEGSKEGRKEGRKYFDLFFSLCVVQVDVL